MEECIILTKKKESPEIDPAYHPEYIKKQKGKNRKQKGENRMKSRFKKLAASVLTADVRTGDSGSTDGDVRTGDTGSTDGDVRTGDTGSADGDIRTGDTGSTDRDRKGYRKRDGKEKRERDRSFGSGQ